MYKQKGGGLFYFTHSLSLLLFYSTLTPSLLLYFFTLFTLYSSTLLLYSLTLRGKFKRPKVHVRGRGCSRTTMMPLRQNRKLWIMPRTSGMTSPMQQAPNLRRTPQLPTSPRWIS